MSMSIRSGMVLVGGLIVPMLAGCDRPSPGTAEPTEVAATLLEWEVLLEASEVPAGEVVFRVRNLGGREHALEVERGAQEWETGTLAPRDEATLSVALEPGEYEVYCPIVDGAGSHRELGMSTVLRVR
jgi:plastocyanin